MKWMVVAAGALLAWPADVSAEAGDAITRVESPVYEAAGGLSELARKGNTCIGRIVKPGLTTAPTIVAADIEGGTLIANATFAFSEKFIFIYNYSGRAKLAFEARPDRFRMVFTEIEAYPVDLRSGSWSPIYRPKRPDPNGAEPAMLRLADEVAACVKAPAEDW